MAFQSSTARALASFLQRGADVDREPQVRLFQFLNELNHGVLIIKYSRYRSWTGHAIHHSIEVPLVIAAPMHGRIEVPGRPKDRATTRVAHIDRIVFAGDFE